jgi:phosphatidylglycerol lysyltransferase
LNGKDGINKKFRFKELIHGNREKILKGLFAVIILLVLIYELKGEISKINFLQTLKVLRQFDNLTVLLIFLSGVAAVSFTTLYDLAVNKYFSLGISLRKMFEISWISNAINLFVGLGGLAGMSVRSILYKKEGIETEKIIKSNGYILISNITGLSVLILLGIFKLYDFSQFLGGRTWYMLVLIVFALYLPLYFFIDKIPFLRKKVFEDDKPVSIKFKIIMICCSVADWIAATAFFCGVNMCFSRDITIMNIAPLYLIGITVGLISFVPSGIGTFDLTVLAGLKQIGVSSENALAAILMYRLFYYIIPWAFSTLVFITRIVPNKRNNKNDTVKKQGMDLGVKALSVMVIFAGMVLILSAATPAVAERFKIVRGFMSMHILRFSKKTSVIIGIILLVLSKGIKDKVKISYNLTLSLLIIGAFMTFIKGLDYEEAIILTVTTVVLYFSRDCFYRETSPVKFKEVFRLFIGTAVVSLLYVLIVFSFNRHLPLVHNVDKSAILTETLVIFLAAWVILAIYLLTRVKRGKFSYPSEEDLDKLVDFLNNHSGNIMTHLLFLKDKYFYYSGDDQMLIPFAQAKDKLVVLGEPIGNQKKLKECLIEFREFADTYKLTPVFYEISDENYSVYHDLGYEFFKLGEEATVDLLKFDLSGKKKKDLRLARNKVESGELDFQIINPPFEEGFIRELSEVSDEWLGKRSEKGFSMGWFDEEYLNRTPIAVIKSTGKVIAFANLMPLYDNETISVDLMRLKNDIPSGTMDALFIYLFQWSKDNGYKKFNLGMAPLSGVGNEAYSFNEEKLVGLLYRHGQKFYSFEGLRKYKEKFQPDWQNKYVAYPKELNVSLLLLELVKLTSKSLVKS